jgi:hypothetical protein
MNPKRILVAYTLAVFLLLPGVAARAAGKKEAAPKKELTREELAKLGGFEPAPDDPVLPALVQLQLIVFSVPKADALTISADLKNPQTSEEAFRKLTAAVKKKEAKLICCPLVETKPGVRCVVELITELRYATEFDRLEGGKAIASEKPAPEKDTPGKPLLLEAPRMVGVVPTSFETRNCGTTFDAEAILGPDGKTMDIQYVAQRTELVGWEANEVEEKGEIVQRLLQPRFHTNKVTSGMTIQAGQRSLVGVFESPRDPEAMEVFVLHATTRPPKKK